MTMAAYAFVGGLSVPALRATDLIVVGETVAMGLAFLYLVVRNPIRRTEATEVDDGDSATRFGSTLR